MPPCASGIGKLVSFFDVRISVVVEVVDDVDLIDAVRVVEVEDVVKVTGAVNVVDMVVLGVVARAFVVESAVLAATSSCDLLLPVQEILLVSAALQRS